MRRVAFGLVFVLLASFGQGFVPLAAVAVAEDAAPVTVVPVDSAAEVAGVSGVVVDENHRVRDDGEAVVASCLPGSGSALTHGSTLAGCTVVNALGTTATPDEFTVSVASFASGAAIVFQATGTLGPALPYPSTIAVSGLTGVVDDVVVTLRGITHTHPDDIDVLLVAPDGTTVALMSDAGGGADIDAVTYTFSDGAAARLLDGRRNASGSYKPSNFGVQSDPFDSPAPAGPWNAMLGAFDGGSPNGAWSLYVMDDLGEDGGEIASWELGVTTRLLPPNSAPRITALDDVTLAEGTTRTIAIEATDDEEDDLTLAASGLPGYATFTDNGDGSATLALAPGFADAGPTVITITASDGELEDSETLTVTVTDTPRVPVLAPIGNQSLPGGTVRQLSISASDADGGVLTYSGSGLPAFATLTDNGNGTATLRLAPSAAQAGTYPLTVSVSDGALSDSETLTVTVTPPVTETTPPTASASVSPAAVGGWHRGPVTVTLTARDNTGGSGVASITWALSGATVQGRTTVPGASVTLTIANGGTTTVEYFATDNAGNVAAPKTLALKLDTTLPQVTAPAVTLASGQLGTSTVPLSVRWTASDTGSGLASSTLEVSTDGGAWTAVSLPTPAATSAVVQVAPGSSHVFRVRATDKVGNVSTDATGSAIMPSLQRESSNWIVYSGNWTVAPLSGAIGSTVKYGTANTARATFTLKGTHVAWVSTLGRDRGIAEVWLDGAKVATIDLYKATTQPRTAVWTANDLADRDHLIEIRVTGTRNTAATGTRVDIDEFVVVSDGGR